MNLCYITSKDEIRASLETFNREASQHPFFTTDLLRRTKYWLYDPITQTFGPNKFVGFCDMTIEIYLEARELDRSGISVGVHFNATKTRERIEEVLGTVYRSEPILIPQLIKWGSSLTGDLAVFDGITMSKRKFISL
jgi:hypothetical protein